MKAIEDTLGSLPEGHIERPGLVRALELIQQYPEPTAVEVTWKLLEACKWELQSNEKFGVLCLGRSIDVTNDVWVPTSWVADQARWTWNNTKQVLGKPRLNEIVLTRRAVGGDGKTRTYYSLVGIGDRDD